MEVHLVMSSTIANRHVNVKSKCWKTKWKRRFFYSRSKREKHTCDRHSKDETIYFVTSFDCTTVRWNFELLLIFEPIIIVCISYQESECCQWLKICIEGRGFVAQSYDGTTVRKKETHTYDRHSKPRNVYLTTYSIFWDMQVPKVPNVSWIIRLNLKKKKWFSNQVNTSVLLWRFCVWHLKLC